MEVRETITLSRLDHPIEHYRTALPEWPFSLSGASLHLNLPYVPDRIQSLHKKLASLRLNPKVHHSVFPVFSDSDYGAANLVELYFPDHWEDSISTSAKCAGCGRRTAVAIPDPAVDRVKSKRRVLSVNGDLPIFAREVCQAIDRAGLKGASFQLFDRADSFFYVEASSRLAAPIFRPDEVLGLAGSCAACGRPSFRVRFGPLRFSRVEWSGDDFVWCDLICGLVYSKAAEALLRQHESKISRGNPVVLE